jgi:TrmH family RNA methyltransferase
VSAPAYSLSRARRLLQPKHRRGSGLFLAEGPHLLVDALDAGRLPLQVFVSSGELGTGPKAAVERARTAGVSVRWVEDRDLMWLLLDGVGDPGNAGTLLRAADAFGAAGALALQGTVDLWSAKTVRAGQGAHLRLAVLQEEGLLGLERLDDFRAAGGELWAADRDGEPVYDAPPAPPLVMLAVGNEARGLSDASAGAAARRVCVPQNGPADSLNVAMAGTVLLSWLARTRGRSGSRGGDA